MPRNLFTINTDLKNTVSPLNAEFIDEYLKTKRNGELSGIGQAVMSAAAKYGINATYIVAHAALETGWGSSRICRDKNNLFGWSAFDSSPYSSAKGFPDRNSCIDFVMGRINSLYLTSTGKYYKKLPCLGKGGDDSFGMNAKYASDPAWGEKIAKIGNEMEKAMQMLFFAESNALKTVGLLPESSKVDALLARARSVIGKNIRYQLGKGGMNPNSELPASSNAGCDCSGFVCWCLGISRKTDHNLYRNNGGWINTDSIVHDAERATGFFFRIPQPKIGALIVYPSKKPERGFGHVGIVTELKNGFVARVIHCSSGNYKKSGDAIAETGPDSFKNKPETIFAWYEGL